MSIYQEMLLFRYGAHVKCEEVLFSFFVLYTEVS